MSKKIFITGTGTDIGKTYVTGLILKKLRESGKSAAYFKAAVSGNDRDEKGNLIPGDAVFVKKFSGILQPVEEMCPYVYEHAYSPHLASKIEGGPVELHVVKEEYAKVCGKYEYVVMEGSGGILCPVRFDREKIWLEDVVKELGLSCLIVADAGLGTINSVVLTAEYMNMKQIPVKGMIFNRYHKGNVMEEDNIAMCEYRTGLKVLACVEDGAEDLDMEVEQLPWV